VGAGDCFFAGLLAALMDNTHPEQALQRAVASASLCVEREGCQPPSAQDISQLWCKLHPAAGSNEIIPKQ
jgi:fructokinase